METFAIFGAYRLRLCYSAVCEDFSKIAGMFSIASLVLSILRVCKRLDVKYRLQWPLLIQWIEVVNIFMAGQKNAGNFLLNLTTWMCVLLICNW